MSGNGSRVTMMHVPVLVLFLVSDILANDRTCNSNNIVTYWMDDDDIVVVSGKTSDEQSYKECNIKLGPATNSQKKMVRMKIQTYYNQDCGVFLSAQQSPAAFFDHEVKLMFNYSCSLRPGNDLTFYSDAGNNIKIKLQKTDNKHQVVQVTNIKVIIGVAVALFVVSLLAGGMIWYLCHRNRRWSRILKQSVPSSGRESPISARYSDFPLHEVHPSSSLHSQTCIVGSVTADGTCTVCNRQHDDFAHVIDIGPDGHVRGTHSRASNRQADTDTLADNQTSTPNLQGSRGQHFTHGSHPSNNHRREARLVRHPGDEYSDTHVAIATTNGSRGSGDIHDVGVDDDEMDISGNDLIPPSYDLSPPSYDEAVNMPMPDHDCSQGAGQAHGDTEIDPLYQNIDHSPRDSSNR
ncbi:hypothetical protein MAR_011678 [Mya arenaria]|uniref:CUB domain-containing protein n=1 Tax=Mya arenaria TaxID=6604 RepID=A0ABY7FXU1_MYAAR|nr:hypothetical protein MAR_011678 [Mya arenaria]